MSFCDEIELQSQPQREAMMNHPFVRGIGDGNLPIDRFRHFIIQDYIYLIDYARCLALGSAKAPDLDSMGWFANAVNYILNTEMELHRSYCASFDISREELDSATPAPTTYSYTSYLLRVAHQGSFGELVASLVPCVWGYWQVGESLAERGEPDNEPRYAEWIRMYAGVENQEVAEEAREICNLVASTAGSAEVEAMKEAYITSTRYEYAFWEMAWRLEEWHV